MQSEPAPEHDESPSPPHGPVALRHVPLSHTPAPDDPQFEPASTHLPPAQHPRPAHTFPKQQGCPAVPHATHLPAEQARPPAEQKSEPRVLDVSEQHDCPSPPQVPQPPSAVDEQVPGTIPPHAAPGATHLPPAQQPPPAQVLLPQHGWLGPPHVWKVPVTHTVVGLDPDWPDATHLWVATSRQAPSAHAVAPGHGGAPATPQYSQSLAAKHPRSVPQLFPTSTHVW